MARFGKLNARESRARGRNRLAHDVNVAIDGTRLRDLRPEDNLGVGAGLVVAEGHVAA